MALKIQVVCFSLICGVYKFVEKPLHCHCEEMSNFRFEGSWLWVLKSIGEVEQLIDERTWSLSFVLERLER